MNIVRLQLRGHLTVASLTQALTSAEASLVEGARLLIDVLEMTGYDGEARAQFVAWNRAQRQRVARVAIVTDRQIWRAVIAAMAFASGQKMKAFEDEARALLWLREGLLEEV